MSILVKLQIMNTNKPLGEIIRDIREANGLLLREVAASLEIDPSLLSKIERGNKRPTKDQIIHLAELFKVEQRELMIAFLSDRIVYEIRSEELAIEAIKAAEQKIEYLKKTNSLI